MLQIRQGVFETNSSSSHSIIIKKQDCPMEAVIDPEWHVYWDDRDENNPNNGYIRFWRTEDLDFEREPFHFLVSWYDRLRYAIASNNTKEGVERIREICSRRIKGFRGFSFPHDDWAHEDEDYYGYVDHQSHGLLEHVLEHYQISLEEFIFNDRYVIVIDGDETQYFTVLVEQDLFNKDVVESIEPASNWYDWNGDEEKEDE